jgi:hypothetical protein
MVSEEYRKLEDRMASVQFLHDDIVEGIVEKLGREKAVIERVLYRTCVTTAVHLSEAAYIVNEFLIFLHEIEHVKEN